MYYFVAWGLLEENAYTNYCFYIADPCDIMDHHISHGSWGPGDYNNSPKF